MDGALVSVVVPAYNQSAYLREALASALGQTHERLEVIVVDDGSTDDTRAVCEAFADPRLRYVHQANDGTRGIGARNVAMLLARGDWIALLDQDDRWHPDKLARQLARARQAPEAGAVFCAVAFIDERGAPLGRQQDALPEGEVFHALIESNRYYACGGIFRRSLLGVAGLPHESCGLADWQLWLSIARHRPVAVVHEVLADYRRHAAGYQIALQRASLLRVADDQWRTLSSLRPRLHPGCAACRRSHARGMRGVAQLYLRAARSGLAAGTLQGLGPAVHMAFESAPGWLLRPWVLLHQGLRLAAAAVAGGGRRIVGFRRAD